MADAKIITFGELFSATTDVIPDNKAAAVEIEGLDGKDYIKIDTTDGSESVRLVSSGTGDVGIGPTAPVELLHLSKSDSSAARIQFTNSTTNHTATDGCYIGLDASETFHINQQESNDLLLYTSGSPRIFIKSTGEVGIGTTEPTHLLSVSGGDVSISDTSPVLEIRDSRNNPGATDLGAISFTSSDASAGDDYCATIVCESINGTAKPDGALRFTMFNNGTANGVVRMENNGDVSIQKAGTAESIVDFLTLENTVNAATMDGTGSAIHFKQYYYDASSPATEDSAKITVATETNWTSTASTRDSYMAFETSDGGTMAERMRIDSAGNVGVAKTASSAVRMDVSGAVGASTGYYVRETLDPNHIDDRSNGSGSATLYIGDEPINTTSDRRIKKNIVDTSANALDTLDKVRVVDFEWDDPSDVTNGKNARGAWTGVIAQEVIDHIPYAVNAPRDPQTMEPLPDAKRLDNEGNEFDQLWLLNYGNIVPLLIKAVQELKSEIAQLKEGN